MTHDTRSAPEPRLPAGCGLVLRGGLRDLLRDFRRPGQRLARAGWSAGAAVPGADRLAAVVLLPSGVRSLRGRWGLLRRNAGLVATYGVTGVAGAQLCYFLAVDPDAGRYRADDRVRRPRRGGRLALAEARPTTGGCHARGRRPRRGGPGAGARPDLRCGRGPDRGAVGAGRDGRRRGVLRDLGRREQRAAADDARGRRPGGRGDRAAASPHSLACCP